MGGAVYHGRSNIAMGGVLTLYVGILHWEEECCHRSCGVAIRAVV